MLISDDFVHAELTCAEHFWLWEASHYLKAIFDSTVWRHSRKKEETNYIQPFREWSLRGHEHYSFQGGSRERRRLLETINHLIPSIWRGTISERSPVENWTETTASRAHFLVRFLHSITAVWVLSMEAPQIYEISAKVELDVPPETAT